MSPPINIDGSQVSSITIDGTDVSEVTVGGDAVFTTTPGSGLDNLWWGPEISDISTFPDVNGNLDLSANGGPTLDSVNNEQASNYDGSDDSHTTGSVAAFGTNDVWTAVLVVGNPPDTGDQDRILSLGTDSTSAGGYNIGITGSGYNLTHSGIDATRGGARLEEPQVIVATYDGSNAILDANKTEQINTSIRAPATPQPKSAIGERGDGFFQNITVAAAGHEAAAADATRRDQLSEDFAGYFGITL